MKTAVVVVLGLFVMTSAAKSDWVKIGPGPTFEYAQAYCDNAAMGAPQQGYFVMGSQLQVGMTQFGYGIGSAIRRSRYKTNCMIMNGWKNVSVKKKQNAKTNWNNGK